MANTQAPGFQPLSVRGGGSIELTRKRVLTNNTTAIFNGDSCVFVSTGDIIVQATGTTLTGAVAQGASYVSNNERLERNHLPAATTYTSSGIYPDNASFVYVTADHVNTDYEASCDEALALTDLNLNYAVVLGTGSTTTGFSGHELDATGRAITETIPWRVTDFIRNARWDISAADAHVKCRVNAGKLEPALSLAAGL